MKTILPIIFTLLSWSAISQNCTYTVRGLVLNEVEGTPLQYATVLNKEIATGVITDSNGFFEFHNLCASTYHLKIQHVGCAEQELVIQLKGHETITINLHHHEELLDEITISGPYDELQTTRIKNLSKNDISNQNGQPLATILQKINGVGARKNGNGIAKPIIHGFSDNRIALINNGIIQSGQSWGSDHAPEIDPSIADYITVLSGVNSLEYGGQSLGGVILIEPSNIQKDPHLHGNVNYSFNSNNLGHSISGRFEKYAPTLSWRLNGSIKKQGDSKTPQYYLTNTGATEYNASIQLEKQIKNTENQFYYSLFSSTLGLLKGSQVSNLTDLSLAITQEQPFFTNPSFSYAIDAPKQQVQHHLVKLQSTYHLNATQSLQFKYGGQLNIREEFDNRRSGRSDIPTLNLSQTNHFADLSYKAIQTHRSQFKTGIQLNITNNTNNPQTGILPLIPDYLSYNPAIYTKYSHLHQKTLYEIGGRYDYKHLGAYPISNTLPRTIQYTLSQFHNYSLAAGLKKSIHNRIHSTLNIGYTMRAPEINELFSNGLHQGVSAIELGNPNLKQERAFKITTSATFNISPKISAEWDIYLHRIQNYIYLQIQDSFVLTIRGAYPLYLYEQNNAQIMGTDLSIHYQISEAFSSKTSLSLLKGQNTSQNIPLVFMPPATLKNTLSYTLNTKQHLKHQFNLEAQWVHKQTYLNANQDIIPPPQGYVLCNASYSFQYPLKQRSIIVSIEVLNIFNSTYRDYLNRLRYFADETGVSARITLRFIF